MIPSRCRRCRRAIWRWPWQDRLCGSRQAEVCSHLAFLIAVDEGLLSPPLEFHPWANPPPLDMHVCSRCQGKKEVPVRQDWETGAIEIDHCPRCEGSGVDPTWHPV